MIENMQDGKGRGTILVVDDTLANLDLLSVILKTVGYRVNTAFDGRAALRSVREKCPDLILLDIDMPELNGFEVCRRLKTDKKLSAIPVLFISAMSDTSAKIKAFQTGGVDYITKPFQVEEVLARVDTHIRIRSYQTELTEKGNILQKTLDDLKAVQSSLIQAEKMASLGVLTAGIAHEINNPINFIKTSAYALKQDLGDVRRLVEAFDQCTDVCSDSVLRARITAVKSEISYDLLVRELGGLIDNISLGVDRAEAVVNSLRTYSRPEDTQMQPTDLADLMDTSLVLLGHRIDKKITISKEFQSLPAIPVHPGRLLQVFVNVVGNALDAIEEVSGPEQPFIHIQILAETQGKTELAVVKVTDNGPGISEAVVDKIFDPFFTTKEVGKGVGLGMYISYGIIRDHQGRIFVSSQKQQGTTVSIMLPTEGKSP